MSAVERGVAVALGAATPLLPLWWGVHRLHPRLRGELAERWGLAPVAVEAGAVWIVASSVGEVGAAEALLAHLAGPVLLTADTDTGVAAARRAVAAHPRVVAQARPVDHPWTLAPAWAEARPRAVVLVEGAWWPGLVARARRDGVPVLGVQARPGRTAARWPSAWRAMLGTWTAAMARDEAAAAALSAEGVPVVGVADLKLDRPLASPALSGLDGAIVAMSTRPGDETALLEAWTRAGRPARLVLAPRHPGRFEAVWREIRGVGVRAARRSQLVSDHVDDDVDVLLLDSLGELAPVVSVAAAAFVGGTRDPRIGGHSPAEAVRAGVPVFAGPHVGAHPAAFADAEVGEDLAAGLRAALARGRSAPEASGAGARTVAALDRWLSGPPAPPRPPRPWLGPVAGAVGAATAVRNAAYDAGWARIERVGVPVIAVGSANARGAGKTAAAAWVARHLTEAGHRVGIAVRGHGRARLGGARLGVRTSVEGLEPALLGDEGVRLAMQGFVVAAAPDRVEAARALVALGCTAVVLDDGLQHRRLHRDLDLVVVDAAHPSGRGPLPAGEARERPIPARADGVLLVGDPGEAQVPAGVPVAHLRHRVSAWSPGPPTKPARVLVGVGAPGRAVAALRQGIEVDRIRVLPDHAPIAELVARWLDEGATVATTAKDAARLPEALRARVHHREVVLEGCWPAGLPPPYHGGGHAEV